MICPCCGHEYAEEEARSCCAGCVAKDGCGLLRCPQCGYECAREPGLVQRLRDWFSGRKEPAPVDLRAGRQLCHITCVLTDLMEGDSAEVVAFDEPEKMRKFMSLGILPGMHVTIVKRVPALLLRVGYSEFAFDHALAATVRVRRLLP